MKMLSLLKNSIMPVTLACTLAAAPAVSYAKTVECRSASSCTTSTLNFKQGRQVKYIVNTSDIRKDSGSTFRVYVKLKNVTTGATVYTKVIDATDDTWHSDVYVTPSWGKYEASIELSMTSSEKDDADISGSFTLKLRNTNSN